MGGGEVDTNPEKVKQKKKKMAHDDEMVWDFELGKKKATHQYSHLESLQHFLLFFFFFGLKTFYSAAYTPPPPSSHFQAYLLCNFIECLG